MAAGVGGLALDWEWTALLVPATALVLWAMVIRKEERYLAAKFGADYRTYQTRVRRWL